MYVYRYEIILKQRVGTEDLFLGLSRKDPSSMCCEAMLVNDHEFRNSVVSPRTRKTCIQLFLFCKLLKTTDLFHMQVKIKLPDTKATDVVLDVKETFLDLRTPKQ